MTVKEYCKQLELEIEIDEDALDAKRGFLLTLQSCDELKDESPPKLEADAPRRPYVQRKTVRLAKAPAKPTKATLRAAGDDLLARAKAIMAKQTAGITLDTLAGMLGEERKRLSNLANRRRDIFKRIALGVYVLGDESAGGADPES